MPTEDIWAHQYYSGAATFQMNTRKANQVYKNIMSHSEVDHMFALKQSPVCHCGHHASHANVTLIAPSQTWYLRQNILSLVNSWTLFVKGAIGLSSALRKRSYTGIFSEFEVPLKKGRMENGRR